MPRNVTCLFLKFLMVKVDPPNVVSHNVTVCKGVSTTLKKDLLYSYVRVGSYVKYFVKLTRVLLDPGSMWVIL
jgi:hypothetical protein